MCWHFFAYVAHLWFLRDVWIRTQSAAVASGSTTNLAAHPTRKQCSNTKFAKICISYKILHTAELWIRIGRILNNVGRFRVRKGKVFPDLTFWSWEKAHVMKFVLKSYQIVIKLVQPFFNNSFIYLDYILELRSKIVQNNRSVIYSLDLSSVYRHLSLDYIVY